MKNLTLAVAASLVSLSVACGSDPAADPAPEDAPVATYDNVARPDGGAGTTPVNDAPRGDQSTPGDGGTSDGGTSDGSSGSSGGGRSAPLEGKEREWTWIPIEGAFCSDGTPTGIALNRSHTGKGLVVFFQGGGACWDDSSCNQFGLASNTKGFGEKEFQDDVGRTTNKTPLDRTVPDNPLKDDSYVYIPYCTGDIHGGTNVATYGGKPFHHVGFDNVGAALPRIVATFKDADRMIVTGVSAGGFGAAYNFWRFKEALATTKAFLIDDSGPPLPPPFVANTVTDKWRESWALKKTLPPGCQACDTRFDAILDHYAAKYPEASYALLSYRQDPVISLFYQVPLRKYPAALDALAETSFKPRANFHTYYANGLNHVTLLSYTTLAVGDVKLQSWITAMLTHDPTWKDVSPK